MMMRLAGLGSMLSLVATALVVVPSVMAAEPKLTALVMGVLSGGAGER